MIYYRKRYGSDSTCIPLMCAIHARTAHASFYVEFSSNENDKSLSLTKSISKTIYIHMTKEWKDYGKCACFLYKF